MTIHEGYGRLKTNARPTCSCLYLAKNVEAVTFKDAEIS